MTPEKPTSTTEYQFQKRISLFDGVMLVMGVMIGSGVFLTSAEISRTVGGSGWMLLVWIVGGLMTIIGAMSYAELSSMFPKAGGQYVYLREAYNPFVAFLYGWAFFIVIECGTIAAVAVAFATYLGYIIPGLDTASSLVAIGSFSISFTQLIAIASIVLLSYINTRGINEGRWIQGIFTIAKIIAVLTLIVIGFTFINDGILAMNWSDAWNAFHYEKLSNGEISFSEALPLHGWELVGMFGVAMVGSLFSSDAWNSVTSIADEVKNPEKNIAKSLFLGTFLVTVVFILCNIVYLTVLPIEEIAFAPQDRVAASAALKIFGGTGAIFISILILVSTFGCNNGLILSGARVYYSMAKDGLFFKKTGKLNKNGVPANAIWIQCIWASLLCLSGRYSDLLNYVIFVVLIFYILTIAGIFILRKRRPDLPRKHKAPGYPILPGIYIFMALIICISLLIYRPLYTWPGLILVLLGVPLFFLQKTTKNKNS